MSQDVIPLPKYPIALDSKQSYHKMGRKFFSTTQFCATVVFIQIGFMLFRFYNLAEKHLLNVQATDGGLQSELPSSESAVNIEQQQSKVGDSVAEGKALIRKISNQCGRIYADALDFQYSIGKCPVLPHNALAKGSRQQFETYQARQEYSQSSPGRYPPFVVKDCQFKWFLPHEACDLIASIGKIHFRGDSLLRQLMFGMGNVLTGNYRNGGLSLNIPPVFQDACQCEKQYQCYKHPVNHRFEHDGETASPQFGLCPGWTRPHILDTPVEEYTSSTTPVVVVGNGQLMHRVNSFGTVKGEMEMLLRHARRNNGTYIPMTSHYPDANKPSGYVSFQGPEPMKLFNQKVLDWAEMQGTWPLRTFEYTNGLWSRDGTHYDDENIVMVQLLLNSLWRMQREHGLIAIVPEADPEDPTNFRITRPEDLNIPTNLGPVPRLYESL